MSNLTLKDVELTGEFRAPREGEPYWDDEYSKVCVCPDDDHMKSRLIFRSIIGTWRWAEARILENAIVESEKYDVKLRLLDGIICSASRGRENWSEAVIGVDRMTATDWRIVHERAKTWEDFIRMSHSSGLMLWDDLGAAYPQPAEIDEAVRQLKAIALRSMQCQINMHDWQEIRNDAFAWCDRNKQHLTGKE